MEKGINRSDLICYLLTFISVSLLIGFFATHLITGKSALLQMDSMAGGLLTGAVLFAYFWWFVYDYQIAANVSFKESVKYNLTQNAAVFLMYAYGFVFIIVPLFFNIFS